MSRYRKVDPRIWNDKKFRRLSDRGKLVFLMILTHPHMTAVGAMRHSVAGMAAELDWDLKAFREAFQEALSEGMIEADEKACLVWLPKFLKYNKPESPNVVRAWPNAFDLLPECGIKTLVFMGSKAFAEALGEAFAKAFLEAMGDGADLPSPNQEQEQEQEQEQDSIHPSSAPPMDAHAEAQKRLAKSTPGQRESIYLLYPRKVGKQDAMKAIDKAIRTLAKTHDDPIGFLTERTAAFARSWAGTRPDSQYIPHPATWFNQGRYDDDPAEWEPPPDESTAAAATKRDQISKWVQESYANDAN